MPITRRWLTLLLMALALGCAHGPSKGEKANEVPLAQLPKGVTPTSYDLTLGIDPRETTFKGKVLINVNVDAPTTQIWLHGRDLKVSEVSFIADRVTLPGTYAQVHSEGIAQVKFPQPIPAGKGTLVLTWSAPFNETTEGLYRVKEGGEWYAFTQFEAQDARRAFPCFDEPSFKVPFSITLVVPRGQTAITNTPVSLQDVTSSQVLQFKRTEPLPTYLLAFAVGPFDVVNGPDIPANEVRSKPVPLRGIAARGKGKLLEYALQNTGALLTTLERYFGIAYPFPKLDLIAVPDFGPGAMENAGAITFKEYLLLLDPQNAPLQQKRAFIAVTMHELAHQWFGDLVTMVWWDDIWLNEAFASWMAAKAVNQWDPAQKAPLDELTHAQYAMEADSRAASRRVRQPVLSKEDVANAFDGITYSKGAAVISMFERWVGEETFRRGVQNYLRKHSNGNATADDFLRAISEVAGKDVATPFRTFLDQPGVPFIEVRPACEGAKPALDLQTSRYAPLGTQLNRDQRWQTPFCVRYESAGKAQEQCTLLTEPKQRIELDATSCPAWVMPNAGGAGYYIFDLPDASLRALVEARGKLTEAEQLALAHSIGAVFDAGRVPFSVALETLIPFARTNDYRLLQHPVKLLGFAREQLVPESLRPAVEKHAAKVLEQLKLLQSPPNMADPESQLLFRTAALASIDVARADRTRGNARDAGLRYLTGHNGTESPLEKAFLNPTFLDLALMTAIEDEPDRSFEPALTKLKNASEPVSRRNLIGALGHARGSYAPRARALMLDPTIRPSEIGSILWAQAGQLETREEAWSWFTANYDQLRKRVSDGMAGHFPWVAASFCSEEKAKEVEAFFTPHIAELPGAKRNLAATLESIRVCAASVQANREDAERYFARVRE